MCSHNTQRLGFTAEENVYLIIVVECKMKIKTQLTVPANKKSLFCLLKFCSGTFIPSKILCHSVYIANEDLPTQRLSKRFWAVGIASKYHVIVRLSAPLSI